MKRLFLAVAIALSSLAARAAPPQPAAGTPCSPEFTLVPLTGLPPGAMVVAAPDLNHDGLSDVIYKVERGFGPKITREWGAALNRGDGLFEVTAVTNDLRDIAVGDVDGDGNTDVVFVPAGFDGRISTFLGDGAGHFAARPSIPWAFWCGSPALGDFDGDGHMDLACEGRTFSGDGTGGFAPQGVFQSGEFRAVRLRDTGRADLLVIRVVPGPPGPGFPPQNGPTSFYVDDWSFDATRGWKGDSRPFPGGSYAIQIAAGDLDGDGIEDVVMATQRFGDSPGRVDVYLGSSAGPRHMSGFEGWWNPVLGDFDGDGRLDLALYAVHGLDATTPLTPSVDVTIQLGDGAGGFGPPQNFRFSTKFLYVPNVVAADLDDSGRASLIVSGVEGPAPLVLMNSCAPLRPVAPGPALSPGRHH